MLTNEDGDIELTLPVRRWERRGIIATVDFEEDDHLYGTQSLHLSYSMNTPAGKFLEGLKSVTIVLKAQR